jgi:predicted metalloprotease with PDZ domain
MKLKKIKFILPVFLAVVAVAQQTKPTVIRVDATQAPIGILHAEIVFPVSPGPMVVAYPKWIPGEHAPTGPINQVVRLMFSAQGTQLPWRRDEVEPFEFHVDVPTNVNELTASLDLACEIGSGGFTPAVCSSHNQLVLNWNLVALYNPRLPIDQNPFSASLRLPSGWKYATPLPLDKENQGEVTFKPVSLKTLVDSPVIAGEYFRSVPLGGDHPAQLDIISETAEGLQITPEQQTHFRNLVAEAEALFGGSRYPSYHMQLSLGDEIDHYTVEHFQASDNRMVQRGLLDPRILLTSASLVPHEYVHSWNGKFRPPTGLDNPTYLDPVNGSLLWVYEGLTDYYGNVLAARSGFWTEDQFRQSLAIDAAQMATHPGRTWRSLQDTTTGAQLLYTAPLAWSAARRSTDFYPESGLMWLDADTLIRAHTRGERSLDDFCRAFFAPVNGARPKPYTFEDVVSAMNTVVSFDWASFFRQRLDSTSPEPPFDGVERAGWKLVYSETKSELMLDLQNTRKIDLLWPLWEKADFTDLRYSIGALLSEDGTVLDSAPGMAAYEAGIVPGMQVIKVNGAKFSIPLIETAIAQSKQERAVELGVANRPVIRSVKLNYNAGAKYPTLQRNASRPDMLAQILAPRAARARP